MAKVYDFQKRRGSKPKNYIVGEHGEKIALPEGNVLEKLADSTLLKVHNDFISKGFPMEDFTNSIKGLENALNKRLNIIQINEILIQAIKNKIKEIKATKKKIGKELGSTHQTFSAGEIHIQEMYVDYYQKTKDSERIEERIAGLKEVIKEVNEFLGDELRKEEKIRNDCLKIFKLAEELNIQCLKLIGRASFFKRTFFKKRETEHDFGIERYANEILEKAEIMKKKGEKLKRTWLIIIKIYKKVIKKQEADLISLEHGD